MNDRHNTTLNRDRTGRTAVGVLLSNRNKRAWLWLEDYHGIIAQFGDRPWFANAGDRGLEYVRLAAPDGKLITVARIVAGERPGVVKYLDGDRFNLRRSNLQATGRHRVVMVKPRVA